MREDPNGSGRSGATRRAMIVACFAVLLAPACMTHRPDGGAGLLPLGSAAPDFAARDSTGKAVRFSDFNGTPRVVYFYPKDETPGCTKEACAFRDAYDAFKAKNVVVFGVSRDTEASHDEFRTAHSLPFPLSADPDGTVQKAYGVPGVAAYPGVASRVSFLVGRDGKIEHVFEKVDPVIHAKEVLDMVK